jgi:site-specific recombinase XerD
VAISKTLRRRTEDIVQGAAPHRLADEQIADAAKRYFEQTTVRDRTRESYEEARDVFLGWCEQQRLHTVRHLNRGVLTGFKTHLVKQTDEDGNPRSGHTINAGLKRTAVMLNWLIDAQVLRISRDDVRVALKRVPTDEVTKRDFLRPEQIKELLGCCQRHDVITLKANRRGVAAPRYAPIHDYILFLLLSGLRPGEALKLTWDRCDLQAMKLHVHPTQSKKRKDRLVDLAVCPSVGPMLERMQAGKGTHDRVWAIHTPGSVDSTLDRLRLDPRCPTFDYQTCRVTAATFLACMPSYGPLQESRQLGHSITTAETFYVGRVTVPPEHRTLEACYGF